MKKSNAYPIDLLIVAHSGEMSGGAEIALLEMIRHLQRRNISMHIISPYDGDFSAEIRSLNLPLSHISQPWWALGLADPADFNFANDNAPSQSVLKQHVNLIRKLKPRVCLTNTMTTPWLAYAAAICHIQHVWFIHELGLDFKFHSSRLETLRTIDMLSDQIFCNSKYTASHFADIFVKNTHLEIVYPLSRQKPINPRAKNPFHLPKNRFILVGAIIHRKGQLDAIKAVHVLKQQGVDVELALIGHPIDAEYDKQLKSYCDNHKLNDRVHFLGVKANPSSYVQYADVSLMCSEAEAFGLVTVEAMLLEKPVIGAKDAGTIEIIKENHNGLFYQLRDPYDLASKMNYLIENPNLINAYGKAARLDVAKRFSADNCYKDIINYLSKRNIDKSGIDLSPIEGILTDYERLIEQLRRTEQLLIAESGVAAQGRAIINSKSWRYVQIIRRLAGK